MAWVATYNTVHGEDDIGVWVSRGGDYGAAMVADGVSATGGGGASFLAVSSMLLACRLLLPRGLSFATMRECLGRVDSIAREALVEDAAVVAEIKKRYYSDCSKNGEPCTRPLGIDDVMRIGYIEPSQQGGEGAPSSTLLAALFSGSNIGFLLLGDGVVMSTGATAKREELWVAWGALPQFYQGVKVMRYIALGEGARGHPVLLLSDSEPGRVYAVATDGVDPAALAEALNAIAGQLDRLAAEGANPAAEVLRQVRAKVGRLEDDASIALVYHAR